MTELNAKTAQELMQLLATKQAEIAELRTQLKGAEVKNVRQIRSLKRDVARLQTARSAQANTPAQGAK